jgi:hypothetical protein
MELQYCFITTGFYNVHYLHSNIKPAKKRNFRLSGFKKPNLQSTYSIAGYQMD